MATFNVGETVICSCDVTDTAGTLVDPATSMTITITQISPTYAVKITSTAMTKDSVGKYHYDCQTAGYIGGNYEAEYIATEGSRVTRQKGTFSLV